MKTVILFFITLFSTKCISQPSDLLILKKHHHTVKNFLAGSNIAFETKGGYYEGLINAIQRDSVFITEFDIRQVPTHLGVTVMDTVASYRLGFNYREITKIEDQRKKGFSRSASGGSLFGGGVLITAVGLGTWVFTKPGTQYYASPYIVAGAAALAAIGYLLLRSGENYSIGRKYTVEYVKVK